MKAPQSIPWERRASLRTFVLPVNETTREQFNLERRQPCIGSQPSCLVETHQGVKNSFDLRPIRIGVYLGRCAEFCGFDHALMTFTVRVVSQADYDRWLRDWRLFDHASCQGATRTRPSAALRVSGAPRHHRVAGTSTDHKHIGIPYMCTSIFYFLVAGLLALVIRAQLSQPEMTSFPSASRPKYSLYTAPQ